MTELPAALTAYIYALAAALGLCMGSFLNCFAYRYAIKQSVAKGRSKCGLCGHVLGALDLVPVLSWLFRKGKCRYCKGKISPLYVAAELICAAAYVSVFFRFGLTEALLKYIILASLLFAASFADVHGGLIPDRLIIIGAVCAFLFALFPEYGVSIPASLLQVLLNGMSVSLPLLLVVLAFDKIKQKETMGGGDIKLMFLIGLYFSWMHNILILILACVIGIVFALIKQPTGEKHGHEGAFAFGPSLAIAAWAVMLWGDGVLNWYLRFFI